MKRPAHLFHFRLAFTFVCWSILALALAPASADESADESPAGRAAELEEAKQEVTQQAYRLRYKFQPGDVVRMKVVHLATTETRIQGNTQTSRSRSVSTKVWRIQDVDAEGNITFVHSVADIDMSQRVTDRPEVRYNSKTDQQPPPEYEMAAKTVGVPLATITINPYGQVLRREQSEHPVEIGLGQITLPLPHEPVKVGQGWHVPDEIRVRLADLRVERIKIRRRYELQKVQTGVATIRLETQVLTPVNDPKVQSQLMQQLTEGTIKFDLNAGRVLSQQMDWDETVINFNGADSIMQYLARFTEELLPSETKTSAKTSAKSGPGPK